MKRCLKFALTEKQQRALGSAARTVDSEQCFTQTGQHVFLEVHLHSFAKIKQSNRNIKDSELIFLLLDPNTKLMKIVIGLIMAAAIFTALYEQSTQHPNVYIMVICIVAFMFGMMRLSAKTPSKNQDKNDDDVQ